MFKMSKKQTDQVILSEVSDVDTSIHGLQSSLIPAVVIFPSKLLQFMPFSLVCYITMKLV